MLSKVNLIPGISTEKKQNTEDFTVEIVLCLKVELKSVDRDMEDWKTSKQNSCHFSSSRPFGLDDSFTLHETWQK